MSDHGESRSDDYLWDRSGDPDPEIVELERLLSPFGYRASSVDGAVSRGRRWVWFALAAGVAVAISVAALSLFSSDDDPKLVVAATGRRLYEKSEFVAAAGRDRLTLDEVGEFRFRHGSRVVVERVKKDRTSLFLHPNGQLHAFVGADAKPEFFQVGTPAARCVDLGCEYTLEVFDDGSAYVHVLGGRVAFRNGDREVFVPAGAVCRADAKFGSGTPLFKEDIADLDALVRAFDEARDLPAAERRKRARALMKRTEFVEHALPIWHLLQDVDDEIAREAVVTLRRLDPTLSQIVDIDARPDAEVRDLWKKQLFGYWW